MRRNIFWVYLIFVFCFFLGSVESFCSDEDIEFRVEPNSRWIIHSDEELQAATYNCNDRSFTGEVVFCSGVKEIRGNWSNACAITIEEGVESLSYDAFEYCKADIFIPSTVTEIKSTFKGATGIISVSKDNPFYKTINGMVVETVTKTLIHINHDRKKVIIPEEVKHIGMLACAFNETIEEVEMPYTVESVGFMAFSDCIHLHSIQLSEGLKEVEGEVFINCSINRLILPEYVRFVDDSEENGSFLGGETGVKSLVIMGNETSIRYCDFGGWENDTLQYIAFAKEPPEECDTEAFRWYSDEFVIYFLNEYKSYWSPNGETEWNGIPIIGIDSLDDLPPVE